MWQKSQHKNSRGCIGDVVVVTEAAVYLATQLHELALRSAASTMELRGVRAGAHPLAQRHCTLG